MRRTLPVLALAMVLPVAACAQSPVPAPVEPPRETSVSPGVTTHFSQGWPPRLNEAAKQLGVATIRDSLHWAVIEKVPGQYDFTPANSGHVDRACAAGMTVLLGIEPRNKIYDGGLTAHSTAAQSAYAAYLAAIAARFPSCIVGFEIGNEINGKGGMTGPAASNRAASHTALLRAVHQRIKPEYPQIRILGGSTNTIPTGFLARLFEAGALDYLDGVVVHPYRRVPENVEWEIARLRKAMVRAGTVKPIWATEFSADTSDLNAAAAYFLKMSSLLQGEGVNRQYWYALIDQKWFPNMGLLTGKAERKPVGDAFAFAARTLAPLGAAVRVDHGDPALYHYRYGPQTHVVWGGRRAINATGPAQFFRADGSPAGSPAEVSDEPLVITGARDVTFGPAQVLADSLYGFAKPPLRWYMRRDGGSAMTELEPIDWQWSSYLGVRGMPAMVVNPDAIGPAGAADAIVRYTSDLSGPAVASLCLTARPGSKAPVSAELIADGKVLWRGQSTSLPDRRLVQVPVALRSGGAVDLVIKANGNVSAARFNYRFRVTRSSADAAVC